MNQFQNITMLNAFAGLSLSSLKGMVNCTNLTWPFIGNSLFMALTTESEFVPPTGSIPVTSTTASNDSCLWTSGSSSYYDLFYISGIVRPNYPGVFGFPPQSSGGSPEFRYFIGCNLRILRIADIDVSRVTLCPSSWTSAPSCNLQTAVVCEQVCFTV